jgi:hypothetical protein
MHKESFFLTFSHPYTFFPLSSFLTLASPVLQNTVCRDKKNEREGSVRSEAEVEAKLQDRDA